MLELYAKIKDIKSSFAFSYALKVPEFHKFNFEILKEYMRMRLADITLVFPNEGFKLSEAYPAYIVYFFLILVSSPTTNLRLKIGDKEHLSEF